MVPLEPIHTQRLCLLLRFKWVSLLSMVLFTPSDGTYRQTSKEIIANANANGRCEQTLTFLIGTTVRSATFSIESNCDMNSDIDQLTHVAECAIFMFFSVICQQGT